MKPAARAEYIVACLRKGGAMYPEDAEQFLAEHDGETLTAAGWVPCSPEWLTAHPNECATAPRWSDGRGDRPGTDDVISHWHPQVTRGKYSDREVLALIDARDGEVLAEAARLADRLIDDIAAGRVGGGGSTAFWQIDGVRMLKEELAKIAGGQAGDGDQATRGEPAEVTTGDSQFDRTDWVRCTHRACPNAEYRAKAGERGWHQGPMDAWLCDQHAPGGAQ